MSDAAKPSAPAPAMDIVSRWLTFNGGDAAHGGAGAKVALLHSKAGTVTAVNEDKQSKPTGGFSAQMARVIISVTPDGSTESVDDTVVVKYFADTTHNTPLGLAREAIFYNTMWNLKHPLSAANPVSAEELKSAGEVLRPLIAHVYWADGDMVTGRKDLVMEDLGKKDAHGKQLTASVSALFGAWSPVNWGKDISNDVALVKPGAEWTVEDEGRLMVDIAVAAAKLHTAFPGCWHHPAAVAKEADNVVPAFFNCSWLSGRWFTNALGADTGAHKQQWAGGLAFARGNWEKFIASEKCILKTADVVVDESKKGTAVYLDPLVMELMTESLKATTWEHYVEDMKYRSWSLIHGDFHPGNMMLRLGSGGVEANGDNQSERVVLLDWEAFGFGTGPQEIAQAMISHSHPARRRQYEDRVLRAYYDTISSRNGDVQEFQRAYPYEKYVDDYCYAGIGRWLWLLGVTTMLCPPAMVQYFQDQISAFVSDHHIRTKSEPTADGTTTPNQRPPLLRP